jgi:hypothetical protein
MKRHPQEQGNIASPVGYILVGGMRNRKLRREIEKELSFLFADFGARFVPDESLETRSTAATLLIHNLRLQVSSGRGEYGVLVSPATKNHEWTDLRYALRAIASERFVTEPVPFLSLSRVSEILQPEFALLEESFAADQYPSTKARLEQIKADDIAEMKDEVRATLTERARQTALVRQVLVDFDSRFGAAEAERINGLFEVFSGYRWNKEQDNKLRAKLNEVLSPTLGRTKAIEVMNRLMKVPETSASH